MLIVSPVQKLLLVRWLFYQFILVISNCNSICGRLVNYVFGKLLGMFFFCVFIHLFYYFVCLICLHFMPSQRVSWLTLETFMVDMSGAVPEKS